VYGENSRNNERKASANVCGCNAIIINRKLSMAQAANLVMTISSNGVVTKKAINGSS